MVVRLFVSKVPATVRVGYLVAQIVNLAARFGMKPSSIFNVYVYMYVQRDCSCRKRSRTRTPYVHSVGIDIYRKVNIYAVGVLGLSMYACVLILTYLGKC